MSKVRSRARRAAMQAIYQWQMAGQDLPEIEKQYLVDLGDTKVDFEYFRELLHGVPRYLDVLDNHLKPLLDRPIHEVDPIERAILRIGAYELHYRIDVPYRVVINEAIELAKTFGADQSHKYVNSILDGVARKVRPHEADAAKRKSE